MATKAPSTRDAALLREVVKLIEQERNLIMQVLMKFAAAAGDQVREQLLEAGGAQLDMLAEVERRVARLEGYGK